MKNTLKLFASAVALALTLSSVSGPAIAADSNSRGSLDALEAVSKFRNTPAESLLENVLAAPLPGVGSLSKIPERSSEQLEFVGRSNLRISIGLPFAKQDKLGQSLVGNAKLFENQNGSTTVILPKTDGSMQVATIIEGSSSPTTFSYDLNLPEGGRALLDKSGLISLIDASGGYLAGVAPAWAIDATGVSVPTHFELRGKTLTQVVQHRAKGVTYPVVADPWFGVDMIDRTAWTKTSEYSPTLSVYPSAWGRAVAFATTYPFSSGLLGLADQLSANAAWSEALSKINRAGNPNPETLTMRAQFDCHFFWVSKRYPRKVSWNLDSLRPYASMFVLAQKSCNVD